MNFEYQQRVPLTASNRRRRELDVDHKRGQGRGRGRGRGRGQGRDPISVEYDIPSASQSRSRSRSQRRVPNYDMHDIAVKDASLPDSPTVQEKYLTHAFPGGPTDPSILRSFNSHVTTAIWHGEERGPLKCHNHSSKILAWPWWSVDNNTRFKAIIEQSRLSQLVRCTYQFVNKLLISSRSVGVPDVTDHHGVTLLVSGLGITERVAYEEISTAGGNSVRLEWLRSQFAGVTDSDPEEAMQCAAKAYLLFLLGCTLFSDKSGGRVPIVYLGLLMDLGSIHAYA
ncbi:protein MAIN-LIKE 2-like [Camellia sinensis]|uniref:protein MAIN-LIKE 2-like n=1 Tax=Camellia sinensis TaxID=4442 RepID=UPI0010360FB4|nr:protein MAIN-LIKE 2-like [Camellia sinensis]